MIYNLVQFLRDQLPEKRFFVNEVRPINNNIPEGFIVVRETSGEDLAVLESFTIQFQVKDVDTNQAKIAAEEVYYMLINADAWGGRFQLTLPAAVVYNKGVSIVYNPLLINSILPLQKPSYIGIDENGRTFYSFNLIFRTTKG